MELIKKLLSATLVIVVCMNVNAQINVNKVLKNSQKKAERNVENRIGNHIDKGVDKTLDAMEKGVNSAVKGDSSKTKSTQANAKTKSDAKPVSGGNSVADKTNQDTQTANSQDVVSKSPVLNWSKYDFIPGTEIIFEDNLEGEKNGEFPSKWDLKSGNIENAIFDGQNVIYYMKCNVNSGGGIVPLIKNATEDYLPDEFTIEFDAYFGEKSNNYGLFLGDCKNQQKLDKACSVTDKWIRISKNGAEYKNDISTKYYPGFSADADKTEKWRHVAVSFNIRALKVYLDDVRLLNVPNLGYNPTGITIGYHTPSGTVAGYIKNIRIAKGAVPLYDKFLTDGKFITTGIKFDVNKATIKPESMGTIGYVVKMMTDHPELKFSVEGHTDSDGDGAFNQKLSETRANAVMNEMVKLGISADRLTSKGHGESKPMAGNDTSEGKAQNRRVEFVKF